MNPILKLLAFVVVFAVFNQCNKEDSDTESIHDKNFLQLLIQKGIDANGDGKINSTEAEAVTFLNISFSSLTDISGIGLFTNLDSLDCSNNSLSSLDVSRNLKLVYLNCSSNNLSEVGCLKQ